VSNEDQRKLVKVLKSQAAILKTALRAFAFERLMGGRVNFTAFDTVKNDLHPLGFVAGRIAPIIVNPQ